MAMEPSWIHRVTRGKCGPTEKETVEIETGGKKSGGGEPQNNLLVHRGLLDDSMLPMHWKSCILKLQQEGFRLDLNLTNTWPWR